jgi:hypothetical protein
MTIEDNPQILGNTEKIDFSLSEIQQIKDFVAKYQTQLVQLAEGKIDHPGFFDSIEGKRKQTARDISTQEDDDSWLDALAKDEELCEYLGITGDEDEE